MVGRWLATSFKNSETRNVGKQAEGVQYGPICTRHGSAPMEGDTEVTVEEVDGSVAAVEGDV